MVLQCTAVVNIILAPSGHIVLFTVLENVKRFVHLLFEDYVACVYVHVRNLYTLVHIFFISQRAKQKNLDVTMTTVSQSLISVMVTMTVETTVMKTFAVSASVY